MTRTSQNDKTLYLLQLGKYLSHQAVKKNKCKLKAKIDKFRTATAESAVELYHATELHIKMLLLRLKQMVCAG